MTSFVTKDYIANSKKVALRIGNWALGSYCLVVTQEKHCIVFVCRNAQCPIAKATFIELYICSRLQLNYLLFSVAKDGKDGNVFSFFVLFFFSTSELTVS